MNRELKRQKLEMLESAETLEEIILASWNIFKSKFTSYQEQVEFITAIDSKKDEFYRKELEQKREEVYTELLLAFINEEDSNNIIESVSKKVGLAWWEIKDLILTKEKPNKIDKSIAKYVLKQYPESTKKAKELSHQIREAKIKVKMAECSGCDSFTEFSKRYNKVPRFEIEQAYDIVEKYDNELYKELEFPLLKKNTQRRNLELGRLSYRKNEDIRIAKELENGISRSTLESVEQKELLAFCKKNSLPVILVKKYIAKLKDNKDAFFNLSYDEQLKELLAYKTAEMEKAQPVINDILAINCGKKEVIDYYYYYKSGFFNRYFILLLSTCQLHSISYMFRNYIEKHRSSFDCFADKDIYTHSKKRSMFLDDELITYDSSEFLNIIKSLKEENLPLAKGLVVQKIKEGKNEKKAAKVIVKKNNIC